MQPLMTATREERLEARVLFWRSVARLALEAVGELREEREWLHDRLDKQGQREFRRRIRKRFPASAPPQRVQGQRGVLGTEGDG